MVGFYLRASLSATRRCLAGSGLSALGIALIPIKHKGIQRCKAIGHKTDRKTAVKRKERTLLYTTSV